MTRPTAWINPWYALRRAKVLAYGIAAAVLIVASIMAAAFACDWTWVSRAGGVVILFGILLSLRRVWRLGPRELDEPTEPTVLPGTGPLRQFNVGHMTQSIERLVDNYAQVSGVVFMVFGTILASYGDLVVGLLIQPWIGCAGQ